MTFVPFFFDNCAQKLFDRYFIISSDRPKHSFEQISFHRVKRLVTQIYTLSLADNVNRSVKSMIIVTNIHA
jgi:hypothetical protein